MRLTKNMCEKWLKEAFEAGWESFKKNMKYGYWDDVYDGQKISVEEAYIKWREKGRK